MMVIAAFVMALISLVIHGLILIGLVLREI